MGKVRTISFPLILASQPKELLLCFFFLFSAYIFCVCSGGFPEADILHFFNLLLQNLDLTSFIIRAGSTPLPGIWVLEVWNPYQPQYLVWRAYVTRPFECVKYFKHDQRRCIVRRKARFTEHITVLELFVFILAIVSMVFRNRILALVEIGFYRIGRARFWPFEVSAPINHVPFTPKNLF